MARTAGRGTALLAGVGLLAVALVVWFAQSGPSSAALRPSVASPGDTERRGEAQLTGSAEGDARLAVDAEAERAMPAAGSATALEDGEDPRVIEPAPEHGVPVRVLLGQSDEPVPFAVVSFGRYRDGFDEGRMQRRAKGSDVEDRVWGVKHYRADGDGVALLPSSSGYCYAFCAHDGLWGFLEFAPEPRYEPFPLRLMPDTNLVVHVVERGSREPVAGAEVALRYELAPDDVSTIATAYAGDDGVARFPHLRQHTSYFWAHTEKLHVELAGAFAPPISVEIDPEDVPERIELEVGPRTALDVTLVDPSGQPMLGPVFVAVGIDRGDLGIDQRIVAAVTGDGRVSFEQLGPSLDVFVVAELRSGRTSETARTRTAPNDGGRIPVVLAFDSGDVALTGRLLLPDGTPAAEMELMATVGSRANQGRVGSGVFTEPDGRFVLAQRMLALEDVIEVELAPVGDASLLRARFEVPGPVVGTHELGDVTLEQLPPLVSGRVIDDGGEPILAARVHVLGTLAGETRRRSLGSTQTDRDGRFVVHGEGAAPLEVFASHALYGRVERQTVEPGATLSFVLPRAGGIAGSVLLDEEWLCDFTVVRVKPADADEWQDSTWLDRPGEFSLASLAPGDWTVGFEMEDETDVGVLVENVKVVAGEMTRDPRLQGVDLRGKAGVKRFRIVDANGAPIPEGEISHRAPNELEWAGTTGFTDGVAHLFTVLDEVDLHVRADGYLSRFVPRAREERDVVLDDGIRVRFRCAESRTEGERFVLVGLFGAEDGMPASSLTPDVTPDGLDEPTTEVPHAGEYEVRWRGYTSRGRSPEVGADAVHRITVRHTSDVQEIELVMPEAVRAWLRGE